MEQKWFKRSHRDVDTYFAGYEKRVTVDPSSGRKKTEYIYHGDYYIFDIPDEDYRRFRLGSGIRISAAACIFIGSQILGPLGTVHKLIGAAALLSLIPLLYLLLGLFGLMRVKSPRMTVREYAFGPERMENVLWILLVLWSITAVGEIVCVLIGSLYKAPELIAAAMELGALALAAVQQARQSVFLSRCVHSPERENERKKG